MQTINKFRFVYVLALTFVLSLPSVFVFAQDDMSSSASPTENYVAPPSSSTNGSVPDTTHSLGTLNKSDLAPSAAPAPSTTPSSPAMAAAPAASSSPSPASSSSSGDMLQPQQAGNVTYVTGGVGEEERNALQEMKKNFNLHVMSADKTGHFVADTQIVIHDRKGGEVLNVTAGPVFYAKLPAGSYMVEAINQGQSKKQNITIHGNEASHVHFSW